MNIEEFRMISMLLCGGAFVVLLFLAWAFTALFGNAVTSETDRLQRIKHNFDNGDDE